MTVRIQNRELMLLAVRLGEIQMSLTLSFCNCKGTYLISLYSGLVVKQLKIMYVEVFCK